MGVWVARPRLQPGEVFHWKQGARHIRRFGVVRGRLFLTDRRLLFQPDRRDALGGGKPWSSNLSQIVGVQNPQPTSRLFAHVQRKRLQVDVASGGSELFSVDRPTVLVQIIQTAVELADID